MFPNSLRANRFAAWSESLKTNEVVWYIGTALAPVVGSGTWPACSASVLRFLDEMLIGMGMLMLWRGLANDDSIGLRADSPCRESKRPNPTAPVQCSLAIRLICGQLYKNHTGTIHGPWEAVRGKSHNVRQLLRNKPRKNGGNRRKCRSEARRVGVPC